MGSGDRNLYATSSHTGEEIWRFKTEGEIYSTPLVQDGVVYVTSLDGYIYALH